MGSPSGRATGAPTAGQRSAGEAGAADSDAVTLTRAQLAEMVNGEVNRREAKHRAEQDRARRRALRDADPIGYAEEEREREAVEDAQSAQAERMRQSLAYYDQHTLLPFLNKLPADVVERLRQETGGGVEGLEGRAALMERAYALLEERIRTDERQRAGPVRRPSISDRIVQKQQSLREAAAEVAPEPEVFGPGGGVAPQAEGYDMNTELRALLAAGRRKR